MMKMASSRVFLLCGLLLAVVVLMAAQVSARDLAEVTQSQGNVKEDHHSHEDHHHGSHHGDLSPEDIEDEHHGGEEHHHHGGGEEHHHGGGEEHHHGCHHCADPAKETENVKN